MQEPYDGIGTELHAIRRMRGLELEAVAGSLRIQYGYLNAIEQGRFDLLPGATYIAGFLRSYANFLGIDPDAVIERYRAECQDQDRKSNLVFPDPVEQPKPQAGITIVIGMGIAVAAYAGWVYFNDLEAVDIAAVVEPPQRLSALLELGKDEDLEAGLADADEETSPGEQNVQTEDIAEADAASAIPETQETEGLLSIRVPNTGTDSRSEIRTEVLAALPPRRRAAPAADETGNRQIETAASGAEATKPLPEVAVTPADVPPSENDQTQVVSAEEAAGNAQSEEVERVPGLTPTVAVADASAEAESALSGLSPQAGSRTAGIAFEAQATENPEQKQSRLTLPPVAPGADETRVPQVYGLDNHDARIILRAEADAWVQVQGPDNELLMTRIMHRGDTYMVPDRPDLVMITGNAGGVEIIVDGASLGILGEEGKVRRGLVLDAEQLLTQNLR